MTATDAGAPRASPLERHARHAATALRTPIALLSLRSGSELHLVSARGLSPPEEDGTPAEPAGLCREVQSSAAPLALDLASGHPRFAEPAWLRDAGVVAYLGIPLNEDGTCRGVLAVADLRPRMWTEEEREILAGLAVSVVVELRWRDEADQRARAERHYRRLVETSPSGIFVVDGEGRITEVNAALADLLGRPAAEIRGRPFLEMVAPEERARLTELFRSRMAGDTTTRTVQCLALRPDGATRIGRVSTAPIIEDGRVVGAHGVVHDVTDEVRLREQLFLSQKLEAVGRLAGGVAHDFNNVLSVVQGNTDLLLMDTPPTDPVHADLQEIRRACERASTLTAQLLAFSRRQVLLPENVDLNARIRQMERMLARLIGEDIRLTIDLEDDVGTVRVDPAQLEQVVLNLAVNARDAMPVGGEITVATRAVEIVPEAAAAFPYQVLPGSYAEVIVTDSGHGMDEEVLAHVFEPFYTTREKARGSGGLGLSTVYGIVKQSGGYIWAESAPEHGSRFRICLPKVEAGDAPERGPQPREPRSEDSATVLLVEDEDAVRSVARKILVRGGYTVLEAEDGEAALRICAEHVGEIDIVLSDVVMPGLSGRPLIERLKAVRPELRVLFMTGYSDERLAGYGIGDEPLDLIGKPFRPAALLEKVREVLRGG